MRPEDGSPREEARRETDGKENGDRNHRVGWRRWMSFGLVILGLSMVAGFALYVVSILTTVEEQGIRMQRLQDEVGRSEEMLRILSAGQAELIHLRSPSGMEGWKGTLLRERGKRNALLLISGITARDTSTGYRLWIVGRSIPVSVAGFRVTPDEILSLPSRIYRKGRKATSLSSQRIRRGRGISVPGH